MDLDFVELEDHLEDWGLTEQCKEFPTDCTGSHSAAQYPHTVPRPWDFSISFPSDECEWASTDGSSLLTSPENLDTAQCTPRTEELKTEARIFEVRKRKERRYRERRRQKQHAKAAKKPGYL